MDHSFVPPSQRPKQQKDESAPNHPRSTSHQGDQLTRVGTTTIGDGWHAGYQGTQDRSASPRQRTVTKKGKKPKKASPTDQGRGQGQIRPQGQVRDRASSMVRVQDIYSFSSASCDALESVQGRGQTPGTRDGDDLQTLAQDAAQLQKQSATSKLMSAVSKHGDAKTVLLEARQARANLHATWKQYLDAAIQTWKGFLEDFDTEDRKLEEQIQAAETCLSTAQENLDEAKKVATAQELRLSSGRGRRRHGHDGPHNSLRSSNSRSLVQNAGGLRKTPGTDRRSNLPKGSD